MSAEKEVFDVIPSTFSSLSVNSAKKGNGAPLSISSGARGFTLVEVLIAVTILSIGILGVMGLAGSSVKSGAYAQNMTQATNLALDRIEALQSVPFNTLQVTDTITARADLRRTCAGPTGPVNRPVYTCTPTNPITLGTKSFTWTYTVMFLDLDGNGTASENGDALKRLDVSVSWTDTLSNTTKTTAMTTVVTK